ncbi:MAG TPA: lytic transglycosylase domain-containing protein [Methylibium sp.]
MQLRSDHRKDRGRAMLPCAVLLAAQMGLAGAQTCGGPLPDPGATLPASSEKFRLVARQCDVLAEPLQLQRAAQLDLYDRGASVTIRMSRDAPPPAREASPPPQQPLPPAGQRVLSLAPALTAAAQEYGLDPLLLHAIAHVESRHNTRAVSRAGARGVMQVMPATGRRFGIDDPERSLLEPHVNVHVGAVYLHTLLQRYGNDLQRVLAAYNAGEGAVDKHGGVPPYPETQSYVREVLAVYRRLTAEFRVSPGGEITKREMT